VKIVSIIIPAYNEENTIGKLLTKIIDINLDEINFKKEIIVVDDGSNDKTSQICKKYDGIKVLNQTNMGKGKAVQNGIKISKGEYILIQDADLEYDPVFYKDLLEPFNNSKKSIAVYGSRYLKDNKTLIKKPFVGQNIFAFLFNYFLSFFFIILYGRLISDLLTGYKVYEKAFFEKNTIYSKGFETDHEITVKLLRNKTKIIEIPIKYYPRSKKEGKKISFKDAIKALLIILKYRISN
jgi:glycosyltransferase involved in cell wall biosynthesis